ncbi:MAG: TonB-dependent receptor [Bryobacteraceae bacterium]
MPEPERTTQAKAAEINLSAVHYGTLAEIGAGQEVARWFFQAGKTAGTVAKTISAYDMAVSDGLYGPAKRYVSRERLDAMLEHEYVELQQRLDEKRGERNTFFVFADTVATRRRRGRDAGHGWLGVRFQTAPRAEPSQITIHVEMLDALVVEQQYALGVVGVNLIYGAFYQGEDPAALIGSLMDGIDRRRLEVDMIKFSGPAFAGVDNRLMALQLVEQGLTDAAMFTVDGETVQPSEVLYNRPVLVERGSFRPVTNVTLDMLHGAEEQVPPSSTSPGKERLVVMEMTMNNLLTGQMVDHADFLARVDMLRAVSKTVLVSNYTRFDGVVSYLREYTKDWIGLVMGVPTLREIFDEKYYTDLDGGILEGLGRLFQGQTRLLVYPTKDPDHTEVTTATDLELKPVLHHLYTYLLETGSIEAIRTYNAANLDVSPADVLEKIQKNEPGWEACMPAEAARQIREKRMFGATESPAPSAEAS